MNRTLPGTWVLIYRIGLGGGIAALMFALLLAIGEVLPKITWLTRPEGAFETLGSAALWVFVGMGLLLLVPVVSDLRRAWKQLGSYRRVLWPVFLMTFPFVAPYLYVAIHLKGATVANDALLR